MVVTVAELVETVKKSGGVLALDGEQIKFQLPPNATHLLDLLREHKQELITILRARGGRVATFPHCPRCASYALYRKNDMGNYECQTCGLQEIAEAIARRNN
jgi:Zn ribbon nucleic-acid-binding protein